MLTLNDGMPYAAVIVYMLYATQNIMQSFNFAVHSV